MTLQTQQGLLCMFFTKWKSVNGAAIKLQGQLMLMMLVWLIQHLLHAIGPMMASCLQLQLLSRAAVNLAAALVAAIGPVNAAAALYYIKQTQEIQK